MGVVRTIPKAQRTKEPNRVHSQCCPRESTAITQVSFLPADYNLLSQI